MSGKLKLENNKMFIPIIELSRDIEIKQILHVLDWSNWKKIWQKEMTL